ncbi:hypothetical protein ACQZV8_09605 [Magnetococcales bacterium HHB-1]
MDFPPHQSLQLDMMRLAMDALRIRLDLKRVYGGEHSKKAQQELAKLAVMMEEESSRLASYS